MLHPVPGTQKVPNQVSGCLLIWSLIKPLSPYCVASPNDSILGEVTGLGPLLLGPLCCSLKLSGELAHEHMQPLHYLQPHTMQDLKKCLWPWLVQLRGLSAGPQTER